MGKERPSGFYRQHWKNLFRVILMNLRGERYSCKGCLRMRPTLRAEATTVSLTQPARGRSRPGVLRSSGQYRLDSLTQRKRAGFSALCPKKRAPGKACVQTRMHLGGTRKSPLRIPHVRGLSHLCHITHISFLMTLGSWLGRMNTPLPAPWVSLGGLGAFSLPCYVSMENKTHDGFCICSPASH